jgi:hypothetical protein
VLALVISPQTPIASSPVQTGDVTATVVDSWPAGAALPPRQALFLRIAYDSPHPVRIQAEAWRGSEKVSPAMMNPSPLYPAGRGEAVAWLAFGDGGQADEIRAVVFGADWTPDSYAPLRRTVRWSAAAARPGARPAWVDELNARQQQAASEALASSGDRTGGGVLTALVPLAFLAVPAYPFFQAFALWWLSGWRRRLAFVPLFVMIPTWVVCLIGFLNRSSLWPLWAIFLSPPAVLFLCGVMLTALARRRTLPASESAS